MSSVFIRGDPVAVLLGQDDDRPLRPGQQPHPLALDVLQRGLIDGNIVITHIFSLDEVDQAFQASANGQALKAIVKP